MPVSSSTEHWIKQDALTINLNHFGDPDYLQVSILAGTVVMAFRKDVIGYNAAHNYRTWPLQAANTYLETSSAVNVYARLTRSEVNALALIVYDTVLRDIEGREISYDENGNELLGESDPSFFYVFVGQISESLDRDGNKKPRAWNRSLVYGTLDSSEQKNYAGLLWEMMFTPHFDNPLNPDELTWIEAKKHLGVSGGVTMFVNNGNLDLPSIYDGLPIDNNTIYWENGILKAKGGGGIAESVSWADITGKPEWLLDGKISYSEIEGTPDLSVYALKRSLSEYVTKTELSNLDYADKEWVKEYVVDINTGNITAITKQMVIEALGYTPYDNNNPKGYVTSESIPSLAGYATEDWVIKKGYLTSIPSEYITESELTAKGYATALSVNTALGNKVDKIDGKGLSTEDFTTALKTKLESLNNYNDTAISNAVTKLRSDFDALVEGDTSTAIDNFNEIIAFLNGVQDNQDLSSIIASIEQQIAAKYTKPSGGIPKSDLVQAVQTSLGKADSALQSHQSIYTLTFQSGTFASGSFTANSGSKTINIPATTSHVSEGSNLYFTNARAVSALGDTLKSYVTLSGSQTVSGEKNFTGGLKVNGSPIVYDAAKKYWKLEGDLLITGGLTMYGSDSSFTPSTIMDAIAVDGTTISKDGGVLRVIGGGSGSISEITKQMVIDALGFTPISSSDVPTALPNPHSLKFGSKLYDGSASKTILASDLGITWDDILGRPTLLSSFTDDVVAGKYLPLTGGTISGNVVWKAGTGNSSILPGYIYRQLFDDTGNVYDHYCVGSVGFNTFANLRVWSNDDKRYKALRFGGDGTFIWDGKTIIHSGNYSSYALPLSGGTIISTGRETLQLRSSNSYGPVLDLQDSKGNGISEIGHIPSNVSNYNYGAYWINIESKIGFVLGNDGIAYVTTNPNTLSPKYTIWHEGNFTPANYLPLSGGTITSSDGVPLNINSTAGYTVIRLQINGISYSVFGADEYWGTYLGVTGKNQKLGIKPDGTPYYNEYSLIHTGNYSSYALPLSGGTMTGPIITPGDDSIVIKPAKNNFDQIGGEGIAFYKIHSLYFIGSLKGNCTGSSGSLAYNPSLGVNDSVSTGTISYARLQREDVGVLPFASNANGILTINTHGGDYHHQLGFTGYGLFYRNANGVPLSDSIAWKQIAFTDSNVASATYATSAGNADTLDGYHATSFGKIVSHELNAGSILRVNMGYQRGLLISIQGSNSERNALYFVTGYGSGTTVRNNLRIIKSGPFDVYFNGESEQGCVYIKNNKQTSGIDMVYIHPFGYWDIISEVVSAIPSDAVLVSSNDNNILATLGSNVASATKLQTARTIWGQSFDGTGNVSGSINLGKNAIGYSLSEVWTDDEGNTHPWYGLDFSTPSKFATLSNWYGIRLSVGDKNEVITNGTFVLSNYSPSIIFRRGTTVDDYCDWTITNTGGYLTFKESTNGTERTALKMCYVQGIISDWNVTAPNFIGNLTGNAASATKLQTARTIWGQSFDGTGDVNGILTINSGGYIKAKDGNGYARDILELSSTNTFYLGYGSASAGGDTYLHGNNTIFRCGTSRTECMRITSSGNVGIGTTTPESKLHIVGKLMFTDWDADGTFLRIHNANKGKAFISIYSAYGNAYVFGQDGSRFLISHNNYGDIFNILNGNVGIGITEPSQKLHVDGNILTTGGVTMYSMRKLKNIVDERGLSLDELRTIKPTRYTWKDGRDNNIHIGGIADDIQQVLPEVVYNANGVLTMDYGNAGFAIASSLIKPVIDHEQRIKALEKENEELKQEIKRLRV